MKLFKRIINGRTIVPFLFVTGIILFVVITALLRGQQEQEINKHWDELEVNPASKKKMLQYDRLKMEEDQAHEKSRKFGNKVELAKRNPFADLFKPTEKPAPEKAIEKKEMKEIVKQHLPKNEKRQVPQAEENVRGFFELDDSNEKHEMKVFKAVFRENQNVFPGKALKIILQEDIPDLGLEEGTILKGLPSFYGERIHIRITAGQVNEQVFKLKLVCLDQEDFEEGIYHDEVARQYAEATKDGLFDEVADLDFKGNRLVRKAINITKMNKTITIEKGKQIFVAIPLSEKK